jgi:hypothetical protein
VTCRILAGAALLAHLVVGSGCHKSRTPEEAFGRLQGALAAGDPGALFDALDKRSRWAWMTVQKSHREAYDIILSNYPEGRERERELRRFERGATLGSARDQFVEEVGRAELGKLPSPLPNALRFDLAADGESGLAVLPSGRSLPFRRGPDGSWGYAGLADDAEERQRRALGDVDLVRVNAADYERAAARNAR